MTPPLRIYFIRHGETAWSITGQHTGCTDLPLTGHGESMAKELAANLGCVSFSRVFSSPRLRARMTCALTGLGQNAESSPELAEWDYGQYEGLRTAEIHERHASWDIWTNGCPGGETPDGIGRRVDHVIEKLDKLSGNVALFSHGQFGRVLATRWIGLPVDQGQHFSLDPASISILSYAEGYPKLRVISLWNATASGGMRA